jgi:hypothetical protein
MFEIAGTIFERKFSRDAGHAPRKAQEYVGGSCCSVIFKWQAVYAMEKLT